MLTLAQRPPVVKEIYHVSLQSSGTVKHNHERFLQKSPLSSYWLRKCSKIQGNKKYGSSFADSHKTAVYRIFQTSGWLPANSGIPLLYGTQKYNAMCAGTLHSNVYEVESSVWTVATFPYDPFRTGPLFCMTSIFCHFRRYLAVVWADL
jgi:hypothetical protein